MALKTLIIKAANGERYDSVVVQLLERSCYADDIDFSVLARHLPLLPDVIKSSDPAVRKVTTIRTVCNAFDSNVVYKQMLSEVHIYM